MNRAALIAGILVAVVVVLYVIGSSSMKEEAGPFQRYNTCAALFAASDRHPDAPQGSYAARLHQLDCFAVLNRPR